MEWKHQQLERVNIGAEVVMAFVIDSFVLPHVTELASKISFSRFSQSKSLAFLSAALAVQKIARTHDKG